SWTPRRSRCRALAGSRPPDTRPPRGCAPGWRRCESSTPRSESRRAPHSSLSSRASRLGARNLGLKLLPKEAHPIHHLPDAVLGALQTGAERRIFLLQLGQPLPEGGTFSRLRAAPLRRILHLRLRRDRAAPKHRKLFTEMSDQHLELAICPHLRRVLTTVAGHAAPVAACQGSWCVVLPVPCRVECGPDAGTSIATQGFGGRPRPQPPCIDRRGPAAREARRRRNG